MRRSKEAWVGWARGLAGVLVSLSRKHSTTWEVKLILNC